jgi:hypothetical protein
MQTTIKKELIELFTGQFLKFKNLKNTAFNRISMKGTHLEIELYRYLYIKGVVNKLPNIGYANMGMGK